MVTHILGALAVGVVAGAMVWAYNAPTWAVVAVGYLSFLSTLHSRRP